MAIDFADGHIGLIGTLTCFASVGVVFLSYLSVKARVVAKPVLDYG